MFTGLIENVGELREAHIAASHSKLVINSGLPLHEIAEGDSIAVNGACLTVESIRPSEGLLYFHCLGETLERTNLGMLRRGAPVNLERALPAEGRFGGHFVTGHVDAVSHVKSLRRSGQDTIIDIHLPADLKPLVIPKGSIAVDGVSLTIAQLADTYFSLHIIPWTSANTNLGSMKQGDPVNLEADIIGKYVLRQHNVPTSESNVTFQSLYDAGFG